VRAGLTGYARRLRRTAADDNPFLPGNATGHIQTETPSASAARLQPASPANRRWLLVATWTLALRQPATGGNLEGCHYCRKLEACATTVGWWRQAGRLRYDARRLPPVAAAACRLATKELIARRVWPTLPP